MIKYTCCTFVEGRYKSRPSYCPQRKAQWTAMFFTGRTWETRAWQWGWNSVLDWNLLRIGTSVVAGVRTPCFHCWGGGLNPWSRELRSFTLCSQKKTKFAQSHPCYIIATATHLPLFSQLVQNSDSWVKRIFSLPPNWKSISFCSQTAVRTEKTHTHASNTWSFHPGIKFQYH